MKLMTINRRPSTLPAVCAPVSGAPASHATSAAAAHARAGYPAVRGGVDVGTSQIQAQRVQKQARNATVDGLMAKDRVEVNMIFGDVRGVPPRGRPV